MATITCPHCAKSLDLPADVADKTVHCPRCEKAFTPASAAVASGEPPAKSTNPDAAVTEQTPAAKTRPEWDSHEPSERRDIAKPSSLALPIILIGGAVLLGLCVCAAPVVLFLGFLPMRMQHAEVAAVAKAEADQADAMAVNEAPKRIGFGKGVGDARNAIAQDKLLLKEHPPLPAPGWHGDYIKLLKERCKCEYVVIGEPNLPKDQVDEIRGWNETMQTELRRRFGANILEDLRNEAEQNWRDRVKAEGKK